jgi:hypothetical protein
MKQIPAQVLSEFKSTLDTRRIPGNQQYHFVKWLRFYLDFCAKYGFDHLLVWGRTCVTFSNFIKFVPQKPVFSP